MVWFMNINLTDDRTTVGSYDNRSSGGVLLMPKERHMREGVPIQPHAHALQCAKPAGRFRHCCSAYAARAHLSLSWVVVLDRANFVILEVRDFACFCGSKHSPSM